MWCVVEKLQVLFCGSKCSITYTRSVLVMFLLSILPRLKATFLVTNLLLFLRPGTYSVLQR